MRLGIFIALGALIVAQKVCADENLLVLKTSSEVYSNVTVFSTTATDVYFTFNNGGMDGQCEAQEFKPGAAETFSL